MNHYEFEACQRIMTKMASNPLFAVITTSSREDRMGLKGYEVDLISETDDNRLDVIIEKLQKRVYHTVDSWKSDVSRIWTTTKRRLEKINQIDSILYLLATEQESWFSKQVLKMASSYEDKWNIKLQKAARKVQSLIDSPPPSLSTVPT